MGAGGWILLIMLVIAAIIGALVWFTGRTTKKAEAAVPKTGRTTRVDGGAIHWIDRGQGAPVVMIHGLAGQLQHFSYEVMNLLEGDFRCIALDRPGCGYSERDEDSMAALDVQARMIAEFLDMEGIDRPLIVGHSLGGALALRLALDFPDKVGGLALIAPLTHAQDDSPAVFKALEVRSPTMRRAIGHTIAAPMGVRTAEATLAMVFAPEAAPADFVTRGGGALGLRPKGFIAASADLVAVPDVIGPQQARYGELRTPGGVLYGDDDRILDWRRNGEGLVAKAPHLSLKVLPGRGHMLPITAPQETADFIREMARSAQAAAA